MKCYNDFINKVNELGFMTLNTVIDGFPAVADETEGKWFTGNSDTDPWCWKDRCSQNKQLAFGNFFGGKKRIYFTRLLFCVLCSLSSY